jgi:transposase, IS5 family
MAQKYQQQGTAGLFSEHYRLNKISLQGDPLERLNKVVEWGLFRAPLEKMLGNKFVQSGPKPYAPLLMFKILILQRYYNLSDKQIEYQILDRLSFCRFLGLSLNDTVPDEKTIWAFRERFISAGLEKELFNMFALELEGHGLIAHEGKIVDASFVNVPRQRNSREENQKIKEGGIPAEWEGKPNKKRQKDTDARWTKKNDETHFGYKNHIKADNRHKFIAGYKATCASTHDSQTLNDILDEKDRGREVWADSAYSGKEQKRILKKYKVKDRVHEKGHRNRPLDEKAKKRNRAKSRVRARVEHIFGFMEQSMKGLKLRSIGMKRADGNIGLINLVYNLFRYEQVIRCNGISVPAL